MIYKIGIIMKKLLIFNVLFCALLISSFAWALDSLDETFIKANKFYNEGNYEQALDNYLSIREQGYTSLDLEYNIANSYAKKNDYPRALLYYDRALLLRPNDADILHNRNYVANILGVGNDSFESKFDKFFSFVFAHMSLSQINLFLNCLSLLIFLLLGYKFYLNKKVPKALLVFNALFIIFVFVAKVNKNETIHASAMVMQDQAQVMYEPLENADVYFTLFAGQKIKLIKKSGDWDKISVNGNKKGWIRSEMIELLVI